MIGWKSLTSDSVSPGVSAAVDQEILTGDECGLLAADIGAQFAELTPRQHALAEFASKLTLRVADVDVDATLIGGLRAAGLSEAEILEAVQVVAIYNSNNRINNALGMQPNR